MFTDDRIAERSVMMMQNNEAMQHATIALSNAIIAMQEYDNCKEYTLTTLRKAIANAMVNLTQVAVTFDKGHSDTQALINKAERTLQDRYNGYITDYHTKRKQEIEEAREESKRLAEEALREYEAEQRKFLKARQESAQARRRIKLWKQERK